MNPAHADKLFAGTGHTFAEILAAADGNKPLPRFAIPAKVRATASIANSKVESENVVALLEGSDPVLKKEFVVLSAHLDHVGVGEPIDGDRIYNGAMDNASGIASLLEVARMMKESGSKPKRSVVFLAVTGEEKGLQGSRYYSKFPTAKGRIVANINMDMYLPLFPLKILEVQGLSESTLGDMIKAACDRAGVAVQPDKEPNRNLFIRSDQYSFIREGVPALAFKFGFEFGTPEEKIMKEWLKKRYHAPSDDLAQPVDKEGAAKFNLILMDLIGQVANAPKAPEWKPDSFFKRFAKPAASGA
jgi:Zn-dependent M28 family amino/carboxypeptidase